MTDIMSKVRKAINRFGLPRVIIFAFFITLCISSVFLNLNTADLLSNTLVRFGESGILVLAMVTGIACGIGLNFGISLGIVGGLLGALFSIQMRLSGWVGFLAAAVIGVSFAIVFGILYGMLLNRVKGSEMTVCTYVGFSVIAVMNIGWLLLPFSHNAIRFAIGQGVRNTVSLDDFFGKVLNNFWSFHIGEVVIPTGLLLFLGLMCFLLFLFMRSKTGIAMSAVGNNPTFARANGISVDKMRIIGTAISTALGALGIIVYAQSYGFLQFYNAPMFMSFACVAAILIGGATVTRAKVSNVLIGTFMFQGLLALGLPVANKIASESNLSEVMRLIVSNGIILYALTKAKGGEERE